MLYVLIALLLIEAVLMLCWNRWYCRWGVCQPPVKLIQP